MSTEPPKAVDAGEVTITMARQHERAVVIPLTATDAIDEVTLLAANPSDRDDHTREPLPSVHRAPSHRPRLPAPNARRALEAQPVAANDAAVAEIALAEAAAILGVDVSEMPRLIATLRSSLVSRDANLDVLLAEADKLGVAPERALATLIALSLPERFASVAEFTRRPPHGQAQVTLSMYVTALLTDELARSMPPRDALRFAAIASDRLTGMRPEETFLVALAIPLLVEGMDRSGRVEVSTAIAALVHAAPELLAQVTRENRETRLLIEARAMAERWHDPNDPEGRGLTIAAAFVLLASSPSPDDARAIFERANRVVGSAAPRIILSCASSDTDERESDFSDFPVVVSSALDRLEPFLNNYDHLRSQLVQVNSVPRAELCNALHGQLTRGSERFYMALLSLLRRHQTFATRTGTRALRTALEDRDNWDDLEVA